MANLDVGIRINICLVLQCGLSYQSVQLVQFLVYRLYLWNFGYKIGESLGQPASYSSYQIQIAAAFALAAALASTSPFAAKSEPITGEIYAGASLDREQRNTIGGSTPSDLESIGPELGVDMVWGDFAFGAF